MEWPTPRRQQLARAVFEGQEADVIVTTEDRLRPWASFPYLVDAGNDWGYKSLPDHRKVVAWSRTPWRCVDVATPGATNGRLIVASTTVETDYTIVAVCIPWAAAHVNSGRGDRRRWEEHLEFRELLGGVIDDLRDRGPLVVAGDFNQRAHGPAIGTTEVVAWSNVVDGERLSDHAGVCVDVTADRL